MAKSKYKNVRQVIASILCDDDFAVVDAAMNELGDCVLGVGTENPVYGKQNTEFQENVAVSEDKVTGDLYYVSGWTEFSGIEEEQQGWYVHVKAQTTIDDDLYDVIINNVKVNAKGNPDKNIVLWIKDKPTGKKKPKIILKVQDNKTKEVVKELTYTIDAQYLPSKNIDPNANA